MKYLAMLVLVILVPSAESAKGDKCGRDCRLRDRRTCFLGECKCQAGYYLSVETGECIKRCTECQDSYVKYPRSMIEQNTAEEEIDLNDDKEDMEQCKLSCDNLGCGCVGFTVKRNHLSGNGKCFLYSATPLDLIHQWREKTKGRWTYYQKKCAK